MKRRRAASRVTAVTRAVRRIKDAPTGINAQRKAALLASLRAHPRLVSTADVADMFGIHSALAATILSELVAEGLLQRVIVDQRRYYRLLESDS
jgi:predicted transcriptional regulator of viral defense system